MKLRSKYAWIVYKIEDGKITPEEVYEKSNTSLSTQQIYDKFISHMPKDEGRFGVYDLEYDSGSDGHRNKLLFFMWAPDTASIKSRMIYASSKISLRQKLDGIHSEVQCTDPAELDFDAMFKEIAPKGATPVFKDAIRHEE
ncbi:cofilin [Quaeritorhiza haematococci]|nr:cofilin [Quaeritorhiza haematococci]